MLSRCVGNTARDDGSVPAKEHLFVLIGTNAGKGKREGDVKTIRAYGRDERSDNGQRLLGSPVIINLPLSTRSFAPQMATSRARAGAPKAKLGGWITSARDRLTAGLCLT